MAEAEENRGKGHLFMQKNGFSRDLLNNFMNKNQGHGKFQEIPNGVEDEIELNLGLSLNGHFGVDPAKRLQRSSSITNFAFGTDTNSNNNGGCASNVPLSRTCSLPVETEEESRKRKEFQLLRRFEAKRKRMEKLQNVNNKVVVKDKVDVEENGNNCYGNSLVMSQGSMGSQGSGSSGLSDFGSQPLQGPGDIIEPNAPSVVKSSEGEQKQVATQPETTTAKSPSAAGTTAKEAKEMFKNFMLNMPCVSTRGDGPNGRHIEGFLYRYRKGEEVRIVCVCHGNFLSPAEFVKHAGGCEVENPLRHIVVNPMPLLE